LLDFAETYNLYLPEAFKFGEIYKTCINDSLEWGKTVGETEGYISFTDMLWLFCINLNKISLYKKDYLLIDECQDLSKAMIKVVEQFYNKGARIIMVGDPNQAIQGFAGADGYCWQSLHDTFNPIELPLYNSFRCPQKHVKIANYLVPYMRTSKPEEGIVKSVNIEYCLNNCKDGEVILSRGKASLVKAYFSLLAKDKKSYIKDSSSLLSTLTGYLGLVFPLEEEKMPVANIERSITRVMDTYINSAGGDKADYLEDIEKCLLMFNKYIIDNTNKKYLSFTEYCSILKDTVSSYNNEGILLSTIHSYKGCEADTVWILNYSQLPLSSSSMLDWQLKQEENLLFVALTRSKNSLYLIN
jgi:superfamily I DNA/RNA helicase